MVELAQGRDRRLVRRIEIAEPNPILLGYSTWLGAGPKLPTLGLLAPVHPERGLGIYTLEEAAQEQLKWLKSYAPAPKPPEHIWFICHQAFGTCTAIV